LQTFGKPLLSVNFSCQDFFCLIMPQACAENRTIQVEIIFPLAVYPAPAHRTRASKTRWGDTPWNPQSIEASSRPPEACGPSSEVLRRVEGRAESQPTVKSDPEALRDRLNQPIVTRFETSRQVPTNGFRRGTKGGGRDGPRSRNPSAWSRPNYWVLSR